MMIRQLCLLLSAACMGLCAAAEGENAEISNISDPPDFVQVELPDTAEVGQYHFAEYQGRRCLVRCEENGVRFIGYLPVPDYGYENPSAPNEKGDRLFVYRLKDSSSGLVLRKRDGTIYRLMTEERGCYAESTAADGAPRFFWLGDDCFASVSSGRAYSYYVMYRISGFEGNDCIVWKLCSGYLCFRTDWKVVGKSLIGECYGSKVFEFHWW